MTRTLLTVPMKDPAASKTRLAHAISGEERVRLAQLLFRRTLTFLTPFAAEDGVELAVVTGSAWAAGEARAQGWHVIRDPAESSLSRAVEVAAQWAAPRFDRLCVIPADLAAPDAHDIASLLASTDPVTICPASDDGTNALLVSPPDALPFLYGPKSAQMHFAAAQERGLAAQFLALDSLSFDIDTTACLDRALQEVPELAGMAAE